MVDSVEKVDKCLLNQGYLSCNLFPLYGLLGVALLAQLYTSHCHFSNLYNFSKKVQNIGYVHTHLVRILACVRYTIHDITLPNTK